VTGFTNLFEAHSFTGRGVMQSYGIAIALAEWIDAGKPSGRIAALNRNRFADRTKWLVEDLHI
jgi:glycine/D-amino acid oxidase-like deaminating enzyme